MVQREYNIRWRQGDYVKLGRAISEFNKKIRKIQNDENKMYLPDFERYEWRRDNIKTRKEFNRVINMLKSFNQEGAEELVEMPSGEFLTKWESKLVKKGIQTGIKTLTNELQKFEEKRTEMPYQSQEEREIRSNLKSLKNIDNLVGYDFRRLKRRANRWLETDRQFKKALQYRENYYKSLEELKNFENYDILKKKLDSIKNPFEFFDYIQQSQVLTDLFEWYDNEAGTYIYSGFAGNQDAFDYALEVELKLINSNS